MANMLIDVLGFNPRLHCLLYRTGIFEFILCGANKMSVPLAILLKDYHRKQVVDVDDPDEARNAPPEQIRRVRDGQSYLRHYIPVQLILVLDREHPELFSEVPQASRLASFQPSYY